MNQVFVSIQPRWVLLQLDQLIDVVVEGLQLLYVNLAVLHIVRHGFVDRDEVFQVDTQDGDFKPCAFAVGLPVIVIVPTGGQ